MTKPFSFTKKDRILKRSEFLRLGRCGKRISNRGFMAVFHPGTRESNRIGITVTRKVGGAAVRNRIKRLVREYFRLNRAMVPGTWDINIVAKREAVDLASCEIRSSLEDLFTRLPKNCSR